MKSVCGTNRSNANGQRTYLRQYINPPCEEQLHGHGYKSAHNNEEKPSGEHAVQLPNVAVVVIKEFEAALCKHASLYPFENIHAIYYPAFAKSARMHESQTRDTCQGIAAITDPEGR